MQWKWGRKQKQAFHEIKHLLSSPPAIVHYHPAKPIVLTTDAYGYGVGAVLSHIMDDDKDQPITCFSKTLLPAERNYSQLDKESSVFLWSTRNNNYKS